MDWSTYCVCASQSALKLAKRTDLFTYEWIKLEAVVPTQVKQRGGLVRDRQGLEVTRDKGYQKLILKVGLESSQIATRVLAKPSPTLDVQFSKGISLVLSFLGYKHLQVPGERNTAA
ncbi:hypothetical protein Peur_047402 [Populus x canadensis]